MADPLSIPFGRQRAGTSQSIQRGKSTGFARRNREANDPNYVPRTLEAGDTDTVYPDAAAEVEADAAEVEADAAEADVETKVIAPPRSPKKKPAAEAETE